jgi:Tfp pilus assembly protein PilF
MMTPRRCRLLTLLALAGILPACATSGAAGPERYQQLWAKRVHERGLDPSTLVNPLALTEEMRRTAREVVKPGDPRDQLRQLQEYLFDPERFLFDYDARGTFSASEAFDRREGNCVSFTSLFIALGRSLGIPLVPGLILRGNSEREGNLVVINTHMVALYYHSEGVTLYDFAQTRKEPIEGMSILDDLWMSAIFLNNRGVEELRAGNYDTAAAQLETAIKLVPEFLGAYGNLGVARRLQGDVDAALDVYRRALAIQARDPTILNNLASLYQSLGRHEEAQAALRAANLSNATPYLLIARGDLELSQGEGRTAMKLYKRAQRLAPDIPEPHLAIARLHWRQHRPRAARSALERALELDPDNDDALRLKAAID